MSGQYCVEDGLWQAGVGAEAGHLPRRPHLRPPAPRLLRGPQPSRLSQRNYRCRKYSEINACNKTVHMPPPPPLKNVKAVLGHSKSFCLPVIK